MADLVAVCLFVGVVAYCVFGGADFGAGFWDLIAGGTKRGRVPRELIDYCVAPVWEANHIWFVYCLVILWSGFPTAFTAITSTLYPPLLLAAMGIVLRGAGFAFRKDAVRTPQRRLYGAAFATSSVLTPYFLGCIAGALASGRVPAKGGGDPIGSWVNPSSALGGVLAVSACAYLAAMYLTVAAYRQCDQKLFRYFRRRGLTAGVVTGAASIAGVFVLRADASPFFDVLTHRSLPLLILAVVCGGWGLVALWTKRMRSAREIAAAAVAVVTSGWGVSQFPYLLGTHLSIREAAAPGSTLAVLVAVACTAAVVVLPPLMLLFRVAARSDAAYPQSVRREPNHSVK